MIFAQDQANERNMLFFALYFWANKKPCTRFLNSPQYQWVKLRHEVYMYWFYSLKILKTGIDWNCKCRNITTFSKKNLDVEVWRQRKLMKHRNRQFLVDYCLLHKTENKYFYSCLIILWSKDSVSYLCNVSAIPGVLFIKKMGLVLENYENK